MPPLFARVSFGCALSTLSFAPVLACPTNGSASIMSDGEVRIGDNTTIIQNRRVNGTQVEVSLGGHASNGVASIVSGDGTVVVQTSCMDGAKADAVAGAGGRAPNGKATAPSGGVRGNDAAGPARDCRGRGTTAMPTPSSSNVQTIDVWSGCTPTTGKTR